MAGVKAVAANVTGLFLQILIHESGHAAMAQRLGWTVEDFRPYPHVCGGRIVGGCVDVSRNKPDYDEDGRMNRATLADSRKISAAGSMASNLSVLALSPLQRVFRPSGFAGMTLGHMLTYQTYDWIFYTLTDTLTSFQGDWYAVARNLDVPVYYFIGPAALNYWLLGKYRQMFVRRPVSAPAAKSPPSPTTRAERQPPLIWSRIDVRATDGAFGVAVDLAMVLP